MPAKKQNPLSAAQDELSELRIEGDRIDGRRCRIRIERERIARAALTGDAAAREQLDTLKREDRELADQRTDVEAAIADAERNVAAAKSAKVRKEEVAAAERRKLLATSLRTAGERADRSAREFAEALAEIDAISRDPDAEGIPQLEYGRVRVHVMDAAHTAFVPVHSFMRPEERVLMPPSARRSFAEVLGSWADHIEIDADRVIAGDEKEAA